MLHALTHTGAEASLVLHHGQAETQSACVVCAYILAQIGVGTDKHACIQTGSPHWHTESREETTYNPRPYQAEHQHMRPDHCTSSELAAKDC